MQEAQDSPYDGAPLSRVPYNAISSHLLLPPMGPPPAPPMLVPPIPQDYTSQLMRRLDSRPARPELSMEGAAKDQYPLYGQQTDRVGSRVRWSTNPIRAGPWDSTAGGGGGSQPLPAFHGSTHALPSSGAVAAQEHPLVAARHQPAHFDAGHSFSEGMLLRLLA